ncbi:MAG: Ig-like domain-containing protein [Bacteroidetes bacterium]|nr:Ig-like domain-containing protein [Bacteroidota bacterium]
MVRDAAGNVITAATVTFTAPTTGARGTFAGGLSTINVATDTNGIATATVLTANTIAGSYNVTASVVGVATPATYALTNTPGPPRQITATAGTPQSTQIATAFPVNFQATVRDTFGNLLSGVIVTFTAPSSGPSGTFAGGVNTSTTNVSGVATAAVFSANIIAGSYQLTATAPGITTPAGFALTNLPGAPTSVTATAGTPQSAQVGTAFATNLTALVRDGASNPVPGILVTFKKPATGASGTFAGGIDTVRTDANGVAVAPVFTANLIAGSYNDSAVVAGVAAPAIYQLTNTSGPPGNITVVAGTPQSTVVNTAFATSLQVLVRDAVGNPVNNVTVTFTAPSTGPSGKFGGLRVVTAPTNVSGIATAPTFTADTLAGSYQVTASAPDVTTPALFLMTNNPGVASRILATAGTPQSAQIGTAFATNFRVRVTDAFDNPIGGNLVTFTPPATGPSGAFQGNVNTTTTDSTGAATAAVFIANFITGTYNLPATATGVATPAQFVLTNTAGAPATISSIAGTPQSTRVNTQFAANLQAIVRDGAGNPAAGISVTFTAPVSGASARFSNGLTTFTTTSSAAGIASATVFANTIVGSYPVNATVSGVASPAIFSLTNTPGIAASVSATAGTPQSTTVNTAFPVQFQATVRDSFNNIVPGVLVTFSGTGGSFVGGIDTARTNPSGVATAAVFVAGTVAGPHTVNASVSGVTATASYALTNLAGSPESVFATAGTPQSTQVNTAFATQLAVAVRDSFNNPVPNVIVTFTVPLTGPSGVFAGGVNIATTNSSGVAIAPVLTANSTAGQYMVTASVPGVSSPAQFFLTNVPGQAASIIPTAGTPQSAQVNTPFATNFRVLVRDASGNPVRNVTVTFTVPSSGPGGMFGGGGNFTTDSNGVVTAPQFTANTTAGRYTVNATVAGVPTAAQFQLTNTPGVANSVILAGGSGQSTTVGTVFPVPLQALVRDNWNNPVPGILVTFTSPSTGPSCNFAGFAIGTATTDTNGIASIIAIANQSAGSYNVVATVSGISTPANFSLLNTAAAPATIIAIAGTPQSAQVGTVFSTNLQALVRDGFSNPVPNSLVQFTRPATGPSGTFENNIDTVRTNSGGMATARPFMANLIAGGPYTVNASVAGVTDSASYLLTNLTGPPGSITILQGTPQITTVGTAFPVQFRVQVRDSANNPVVNTPVTFFPPQGGVGGSFQGTGGGPIDVPTDQNGISEAPVFIANTIAGSYSVGASAPSVSSPATFQMTNRPGAPKRLYSVAGTPQSAQISTAFATNFQAAVEDTFANMVPNVLVKWTQPSSGPSGSFSGGRDTARTLANGIATAPVFVANIIAGTYTVRATTAGVVDTANYSLRNTPGAPATISVFQGSGQSTIVNTSFGSTLQALVTDGAGNGVGGVLVQFSVPLTGPSCVFQNGIDTVRTQENGIANSQPFSANSVAGTYFVSASAPGVSQPAQFTLTNRPTVPATIVATAGTPQSAQVNTNFTTPFRAVVRDSFANPISSWRVTFIAPSSGPGGSFQGGGNQWMTNDSGVVTANTFTANGNAGSYVVQAFAENLSATANYNLTNTPGQAGNVTVVAGNQQSAVVNTLFSLPLSVRVTDGSGNPVGGVSVTFTAPATGPSGTFPGSTLSRIVQTDTGGIARADSFRANTISGSYDVNATVQGLSGTGTFTLSNTVGPLNAFVVEAAGGGNIPAQLTRVPFSVRISAKDAFNNTVAAFTGTVTITSNGRLFSGGGVTSTFSNGQLTHQIVMDKAGSGITITATRTSGGTQTGTSNAFQVNNPVPTLATVSPSTVSLLETIVLVLRGTGFIDTVTTVNVGTGITINSVVVDSLTQLRANVTITSSATTGERNITISNGAPGGGTSNQVALMVDMPIPPAPTLSGGPADSSMNVPTTVTLAWSQAPLATNYHLQVSTVATFTTTVFNDTTLTATSRTLGPPTIQDGPNGTKYYWRVRAKNSRGFGPFSSAKSFTTLPAYPQAYTLTTTVVYPDRPTQGDYLPTDYRIVGLPGDGLRGGITIPQLLPGTQHSDWIVYRDNGADQNYFEPYDASPSFSLAPGRAFWVLKKGVWSITSVSVPTATLNTQNQSVQIGLQNGWNLITNPYTVTIPWTVVRAANGNFSDKLFAFNGAFMESEFLPYGGYYFFNSGSLTSLRIPFGNYSSVGKSGESGKQGEWKIGVVYSAGGFTDNTLVFGILSDSRPGLDSLEYRKPRAFDGIPTAFFNRPEWDARYSMFASDFRPEVERLETWTFNVRAKLHEAVTLRFNGIGDVPEALNVYLIDRQRARYADLRKEPGYTVPLPTGSAELEIAVGTEEAIREVLSSIIPKEFALGNNFPNPFNPVTTIPIALPHTADVTLKIYNTLGQEVRTVFSGTLEAGRYFYTWDGRNESGSTVASGIYFTRFRALNGPTFTGKMILIK